MQVYDDLSAIVGAPVPAKPPIKVEWRGKDGLTIRGLDWGADGEPCLFLHGGAMSAQTWTLCSLLLRHRYRCVAVDLRGHGDSEWSEDYSISTQVDDICCVLAKLGWTAPHLIGMSLGGVVAGHTCSALADQPPRSLTLIDVAPGVSFEGVDRIRDFMAANLVAGGPEALVRAAETMGATQSVAELRHRYRSLTRTNSNGDWVWKHDTRRPTDFAHILEHIEALNSLAPDWRMPCLVARGGKSRILSDEAAKVFAAKCHNGHSVSVSEAGHSVQEDNPIELAALLEQFWSTVRN